MTDGWIAVTAGASGVLGAFAGGWATVWDGGRRRRHEFLVERIAHRQAAYHAMLMWLTGLTKELRDLSVASDAEARLVEITDQYRDLHTTIHLLGGPGVRARMDAVEGGLMASLDALQQHFAAGPPEHSVDSADALARSVTAEHLLPLLGPLRVVMRDDLAVGRRS